MQENQQTGADDDGALAAACSTCNKRLAGYSIAHQGGGRYSQKAAPLATSLLPCAWTNGQLPVDWPVTRVLLAAALARLLLLWSGMRGKASGPA